MSSKGKNIYSYIPKFTNHFGIQKGLDDKDKIDLKKAPEEIETEPTKEDDNKLYNEEIIFRFYSKSKNVAPGEGKEKIPEKEKETLKS